jgi:uncharacterized membrane protein (DUF4010 family)
MDSTLLLNLGITVGLGLLVGLQRERAADEVAGIRTFTIIALLGFVCGVLSSEVGDWIVPAGLLALVGLIAAAGALRAHGTGTVDSGITTEVAALVLFALGTLLALDHTVLALVVGGGVAVLLHWKEPMHAFAGRIEGADFEAIFRLALIGLVILPVLPNRDMGPAGVLNPFEIWLMVVLIVGISMAGYVAFKLLGSRGGAVAAGLLGGLISSTATTVSYARRSASDPGAEAASSLVLLVASVVVYGRVLAEIAIVAPPYLSATAPPLVAAMAVMAVLAVIVALRVSGTRAAGLEREEPPSELRAAIAFGLLYALVLVSVALARERFGPGALFGVAALSGLTDMDAITLSTAQLMNRDDLPPETGWRLIMVGAMANLVFKGGVVAALGSAELRRRIVVLFGASLAGSAAILLLWPG